MTTAQVLNRSVSFSRRGGNRHYFFVQFTTEAGQLVQEKVLVNKQEYSKASDGSNVSLRYVALAPAICAVGEPVPVWTSKFISGAFFLFTGGVVLVMNRRLSKVAEKVAKSVAALGEAQYEYAPVDTMTFTHLDLAWYGTSQVWLEQQGFAFLGDEENLTFQRISNGNRTLLRTMLGQEGTCLAYVYHFKPASARRALSGDGFKILELQTHFSDGSFVCSSNAETAGKLDPPPGVDALRLPANSSPAAILAAHTQRVGVRLAANPGLAAGPMSSLQDVHRVQNVLQGLKAAHRKTIGITKPELQRLAGDRLCPEQIESLHANVEKLRAEEERKAA